MLLFPFLLFSACVLVALGNQSFFLIGDSVSARLYNEGLVQVFRCLEVDPNITFKAETTTTYEFDKGRICTAFNVTRIGYMIHFGVFDSTYHTNWKNHMPEGGTENSRTNIKLAVKEFQNRTKGTDDTVVFIFLSSLWDIKRYTENNELYHGAEDWMNNFSDEYTSLMLELRKMLRKQDSLVIATMHKVLDFDVTPLNERTLHVARHLRIPVFDQAYLLGPNTTYLADRTHQKPKFSRLLAQNVLANNFNIIPECVPLVTRK